MRRSTCGRGFSRKDPRNPEVVLSIVLPVSSGLILTDTHHGRVVRRGREEEGGASLGLPGRLKARKSAPKHAKTVPSLMGEGQQPDRAGGLVVLPGLGERRGLASQFGLDRIARPGGRIELSPGEKVAGGPLDPPGLR